MPHPQQDIRWEWDVDSVDPPEHCVICAYKEIIDRLYQNGEARMIASQRSAMGVHPIYEIVSFGKRLAIFHPGLGAPMAGMLLEGVIALGCRKFIACGKAWILDERLKANTIFVPSVAIRDEGTSYHYLPPGREVNASRKGVFAIKQALGNNHIEYTICKTWTTDAPFRLTQAKINLRKSENCLTVETETSAY